MLYRFQAFQTTSPHILDQFFQVVSKRRKYIRETQRFVREVTGDKQAVPSFVEVPPLMRLKDVDARLPESVSDDFRQVPTGNYVPVKESPFFEQWKTKFHDFDRIGGVPWVAESQSQHTSFVSPFFLLRDGTLYVSYPHPVVADSLRRLDLGWERIPRYVFNTHIEGTEFQYSAALRNASYYLPSS